MPGLAEELKRVPPEVQARVHRKGALEDQELASLIRRPDADPAMYHPDHPERKSVARWDDITRDDEERGERAIREGEVAFVVLAGGTGTRVGTPKVFLRLEGVGLSLLGWKLLQAGNMPVWVMTTPDMTKELQRHISALALPMGLNGCIFEQFEGYRLTPDNRLQMGTCGLPELYPLGHGDVGPALVENDVLNDNPQVKYAYVCNVDNVLASPHPGVVGRHIRKNSLVTCEVVRHRKADRGGCLAWVNNHLQVAEDFRLPPGFAEESKWHNTNTMIINVEVLRYEIPWRWHRVRKHVDNRIVVQYERLLQQYTEECQADFLEVPRKARYCPIKEPSDLKRASKLVCSYHFT